jgi:6-phosphogluconolactonase
MAQETLLLRAEVPMENIHRMHGELEDSEQAARLYEDEIRKSFPGIELPGFDLVLLGMGKDGHTASLFPDTRWDEDRWVIASQAPSPPYRRISMTPLILNAAKHVIFIVSGQSKATALKKVLEDPSCGCPAGRIRPSAGSLLWMVDQPAASTLSH